MQYFIHIPKTAGTSFRLAAEECFGAEKVIYDYGEQSPVTSACVRHHLYDSKPVNWDGLLDHWHSHPPSLVAGHTPLNRFCPPIPLADTLTFLREPLARCFSEYLHVKREQRHAESFRAYFSSKAQINRQSRALSGVPFQALGMVGITERYKDSLRLINDRYGWRLKHRKTNTAGWFAPKLDGVSASDRAEFARLNATDLALYEAAVEVLDQRLTLHRSGQPFVHGGWSVGEDGQIRGWAWWAGGFSMGPVTRELVTMKPVTMKPVTVELWRDGEVVESRQCNQTSAEFAGPKIPQAGPVGFVFSEPLEVKAQAPAQALQVRVAQTHQALLRRPSTGLLS